MTKKKGCLWLLLVPVVLIAALVAFMLIRDVETVEAVAFEGRSSAPVVYDESFVPEALGGSIPQFPGLAPTGSVTIHSDAFQSDTHPGPGPLGSDLEVTSRLAGSGNARQCATILFRTDGNVVAMCGGLLGFRVVMLDPADMSLLAKFDLPSRPSNFQAVVKRDMEIVFSDSSGAYMFLDDQDRVVLSDSKYRVQRLEAVEGDDGWELRREQVWSLKDYVPSDCQNWNNWFASGPCDVITTVMPGPDGRYWWVTRNGIVGTLNPETGAVAKIDLDGEEIQNAIAMDDTYVYVLSDTAQYAMTAGADGVPQAVWSYTYDRGSARKLGAINQGSGTTPTLLGTQYLAFADNADGRGNAVVIRRDALAPGQDRLVCKVPMFDEGASATENSMIGWGRSIIIENNAGFRNAITQESYADVTGGVMRIDINEAGDGCDVIWTSPLKVPSVVPKMARGSGVAWFTSFTEQAGGEPEWALVGLDFKTGREVLRIPTGTGNAWNNNWSAIAIAEDGTLYQGSYGGLIQVRAR